MPTPTITLTREELYEKVWSRPMQKLATEFGLSDVGLARRCRRHRIPVPARGYWARLQAGQDVEQTPLPSATQPNVLGISVETLRKWLKDETDAHALESVRFHRLLNLTQLAKGVIRPDRLGHWVHHENQALGKLLLVNLLADAAGYEMVAAIVEDVRASISD